MHVLFGTNEKWYSSIIRKSDKSRCSHMGLRFFPYQTFDLVADSSAPRSRLSSLDEFKKRYRITDVIHFETTYTQEKELFLKTAKSIGLPYDWDAWIYGMFRIAGKMAFNIPFPETNPFDRKDKMLCTEILEPISDLFDKYFNASISTIDLSAKTPGLVYDIISKLPSARRIDPSCLYG